MACCHQRVLVSPPEAVLLLPALRQRTVKVRLRRLAALGASALDPFHGWLAGRIACPLLSETGDCDAYGSRPAACREHLAQSDPTACWDPGGLGVDLVVPRPRFSSVLAVACSWLRGGVDERIPLDGALAWARGHRRLLNRRWSREQALAAFEEALAREWWINEASPG